MALPTLQKTWQYNVNVAQAATGTALATNRALIRAIKNALIGFATLPWTVRYSCDSVTAGSAGDAVDRWDSDTDLVFATAPSAHSWIVLRQTGIASAFELLISMPVAAGTGTNITMELSATGFSGGSTTARPTASDSVSLFSGQAFSASDVSYRWNVWQSTDGQCTRIAIAYSSNFTFLVVIDKPSNATAGWTNPYYGFANYNSSGVLVTSFVSAAATGKMRSGSTTGNVTYMIEGIANNITVDTTIGNLANEIDSSWDMWPLSIASYTTGVRGRHGNAVDLWMVSAVRANSDMIPGDGSNQFAVFKPFIFPWNGSAAPAFS